MLMVLLPPFVALFIIAPLVWSLLFRTKKWSDMQRDMAAVQVRYMKNIPILGWVALVNKQVFKGTSGVFLLRLIGVVLLITTLFMLKEYWKAVEYLYLG